MGLKDRVALVTGSAQGIGRVTALRLAEEGCKVILSDVNEDRLNETLDEFKDRGFSDTVAIKADVSQFEDAKRLVEEGIERLNSIDILVNNAGITRDNLVLRMSIEEWNRVISINLTGVFNCTKAAVRHMARQRFGRIINIASIVGVMGNAGQANYAASKAGVIGFTKTVAREFAQRGITCNAIAPGFIVTAMTDALPEKVKEELMRQIPMGRLGTPEDVANVVVFLSSDAAGYITGQVINVNGGMYM